MQARSPNRAHPVPYGNGLRNGRRQMIVGRDSRRDRDLRQMVSADVVERRMPHVGVVERPERRGRRTVRWPAGRQRILEQELRA